MASVRRKLLVFGLLVGIVAVGFVAFRPRAPQLERFTPGPPPGRLVYANSNKAEFDATYRRICGSFRILHQVTR